MPDPNLPDSPEYPPPPAADEIDTLPRAGGAQRALNIPKTDVILRCDGRELARSALPPGRYVIGAAPESEIRAETPLLSARHALLTIDFDHAALEDLGSSHGTFVAGQRIVGSAHLYPNQAIRLGDVDLEVRRRRDKDSPEAKLAPARAALRRFVPDESLAGRRYAIGPVVARGGMGAILEAQQAAMKRRVAMKVMLKSAETADLARFVDEAQITGQLEHPNIVPIYELGVDENDKLFYTMKFVRGITLKKVLDLLAQGAAEAVKKYPLPALLTIFQKACDAIAFAHSKGVIHRDLKPENLMLGDFGEVLVMDWGLAKVIANRTSGTDGRRRTIVASVREGQPEFGGTLDGSVVGTPQYMAPEQARGEVETLDQRADVYALGAILYHLLALRPPVAGIDAMAIVGKVARGETEPLVSPSSGTRPIPDSLAVVCLKAMALDPEARYQGVPALQAEIEAFQNGFATSAENAGAARQLVLLMKRHRTVTALLFTMLLLSVAFVLKVMASERRATANERSAQAAKLEAQRAAIEAERAAAMVSDAHDSSAKTLGTLIGNLAGKVSPEVFQASKTLVFQQLDDAESGGSDAASVHARSVAMDTKGFIQQQAGDFAGALDRYRRSLALREEAAKAGRSDLALHDLAVSYDNLGDVQAAASKSGEALKSFQKALDLSRELLSRDPENPRWKDDLAVSEGKVAAIYFDEKDYRQAASHYQEGLKLAEALAARDQSFAKWRALRGFFLGGVGRTALRTGDFAAARRYLTRARASLLSLQGERNLSAEQSAWIHDFEQDLAALPPP